MASSTTDVFVSYKAEDRAQLLPLVKALEAEGYTVWWDVHIDGGTDWREQIQQHLDAARCVIVAWSKRSVGPEGRFVRDEATRAQRAGSYVPLRIDPVEPPLGFGEVQVIDFVRWKGGRTAPCFFALVKAVNTHLTGDALVDRRVTLAQPKVSRRTVMAGGAGALAIVGIGGWTLLKPGSAASSNRIAVMSFSNMSGDPAQAYFSDGIAEELRGALSRVGMEVIGKASCEAVKDLEIPAAAAKLGVANIVTGSVRRSAETIRIGAQLVSGEDGVEKWGRNYDRAPGDTISIQTDIATQVAGALSIALGTVKKAALTLGGTADARAQDLYLQAEALGNSADSAEAFRKTVALFDAVLARDPIYGDAHLGKAAALARYAIEYTTSPAFLTDWLNQAEQSARRGAALMPGSGRATATLAFVSSQRLDFRGALNGFREALAAQPSDPIVLHQALEIFPWLSDGASALPVADRFIALDPLNPSAYVERGGCLRLMRRYEESIATSNKALALAPQRNQPRYHISESLILLNRPAEARAVLAKVPPDDVFRHTDEAIIAARGGNRTVAESIMAKVHTAYGDSASYQYAQIYTQLGDLNRAFAALEKAVVARDPGLLFLKRDPFLDPIRGDQRYTALLQRLNFP
jgi:TolB-like protein